MRVSVLSELRLDTGRVRKRLLHWIKWINSIYEWQTKQQFKPNQLISYTQEIGSSSATRHPAWERWPRATSSCFNYQWLHNKPLKSNGQQCWQPFLPLMHLQCREHTVATTYCYSHSISLRNLRAVGGSTAVSGIFDRLAYLCT